MLRELIQYARQRGISSEPGFKAKAVKWLLIFDARGQYIGVQSLLGKDASGRGHVFPKCPHLTQPEMLAAGPSTRHFLVDSLNTVVLLNKSKVSQKVSQEHDSFIRLLRQASETIPLLAPVAAALTDEQQFEVIRLDLEQQNAKPTDTATLASRTIEGEVLRIVEQDIWHDWWRAYRQELLRKRKARVADKVDRLGHRMLCQISGRLVFPATTHPKISGLLEVGGLPTGDSLTSFDKQAFRSYGLDQGLNAAMSEEMATAYVGALNDLLRNRSRCLAGVKVVHWYSSTAIAEEDDVIDIVYSPERRVSNVEGDFSQRVATQGKVDDEGSRLTKLTAAVERGGRTELLSTRFYSMILSANGARVVVRDWIQGSYSGLLRNASKWFDDLAIIGRDGHAVVRDFKLLSIIGGCLRDLEDATPATQTSLWRAALLGEPIPLQCAIQALRVAQLEILNGQSMQSRRFALLKAFLIRTGIPITAALSSDKDDASYLCGRILALLALIQRRALGDIGAGLVQRHYLLASAAPATVLGRLCRTVSAGFLSRVYPAEARRNYQQQLTELWTQIRNEPPMTLTLQEQMLFAIGYYHQFTHRSPFQQTFQPGQPVPSEGVGSVPRSGTDR